jgi:hypothetical protein|tara:strand:- start:573 stop:791 length:219 start_codon:yes stop_codon:yes gene_type:complete
MSDTTPFEPGDLVRWYESYHDVLTTKDTGVGLIVSKQTFKFDDSKTQYTNYRVYRNKHHDVVTFDLNDLIKV